MCFTKKKQPERVDFFSEGARKMPRRTAEPGEVTYRDPGVKVCTRGCASKRPARSRVPEHPLEVARFERSNIVYQPSRDLPAMGWIQNCLFCASPTTSLIEVGDRKGYCCGRCARAFSESDKTLAVCTVAGRRP
jgi:hypothetical protein